MSKQGEQKKPDSSMPTITPTIEDLFGKDRLSEKLAIDHMFKVNNPQRIGYCLLANEQKTGALGAQAEKSGTIFANMESASLESRAIGLINRAQEVVCICSFLFENNTDLCKSLYVASKRGVRVYLLLASQVHIEKNKESEDNDKIKGHVEFLNEAGQGYMFIRSGEVHSKFILVDPKGVSPGGLLFTANLTGRALSLNNELGVSLSPSQVAELFQQFLFGFYTGKVTEYRYDSITKRSRLEAITPMQRELTQGREIVFTTQKIQSISAELARFIKELPDDSELLISSWNFFLDNPISKMIIEKANSHTMVMLHDDAKNYEAMVQFLNKGAQVRFHPLHHAKAIMSPSRGMVFSANFESQGLEKGFESGVIINDQADLAALKDIFTYWFNRAEIIGLYDKHVSQLVGKRVIVVDEKNISSLKDFRPGKPTPALKEVTISDSPPLLELSLVWPLERYVKARDPANAQEMLQADKRIPPLENHLTTTYHVTIKPEVAPANLIHWKVLGDHHIWHAVQGKKFTGAFLVFNKDPFKHEKELNDAISIAKKEGAKVVLY
jgi:phosphatidylserine/phosphatidylglycerophosphate/cardiolipin synthase-like enzyme